MFGYITMIHARLLLGGVSNDTIYRLMRQGKLNYWKFGRGRMVCLESVQRIATERGIDPTNTPILPGSMQR